MVNRSLIGRVCRLHPFDRSRYLHPNHHRCQLLQSDVWTLSHFINVEVRVCYSFSKHIIFSTKAIESFAAVWIVKETRLENWQRVSSTRLSKTLSLSLPTHRQCKWRGGSSGSLILLLFMRSSQDCREISVYGSSKVYWSQPDVLDV